MLGYKKMTNMRYDSYISDTFLQEGGNNCGLYMKTSFIQGDVKVLINTTKVIATIDTYIKDMITNH